MPANPQFPGAGLAKAHTCRAPALQKASTRREQAEAATGRPSALMSFIRATACGPSPRAVWALSIQVYMPNAVAVGACDKAHSPVTYGAR